MAETVTDLDLFGPHFQADPPAAYERLRATERVHFAPKRDDIRRWSVAAAASIGGMPDAEAHLHLERATTGKQLFGSAEVHRERLAAHVLAGRAE